MEISPSESIDISDYSAIVRKHIVVIVLIPVLCVAAAIGLAMRQTPTYRASASVYLSLQAGETVSELVQGSTYVQNLVRSYSAIANMPIVLEPVIARLGLETTPRELSSAVKVSAPLDTSIIKIEVTDPSPNQAAAIANAMTDQLARTASVLAPSEGKTHEGIKITTVAPAVPPQFPSAPNKKLDAVVGLVLGVLLAVAYVVGREALNTKVRSEADLENIAPLLAAIPTERALRKSPLTVHQNQFGPTAEAFRLLRTNLQFVGSTKGLRSLVITSPSASEGKSTVAISLAEAYAKTQRTVLLIDADLRRPSLAGIIGIEGAAGLTSVLAGTTHIADVYQEYGTHGVTVVTAGQIPPNPSELLGSDRMGKLLEHLRTEFDVVILDTAPLLPVTDGAVLAQQADATVVVVRSGRTKRTQLRRALARLQDAGITPVGIVLNAVARTKQNGYTSYEPTNDQQRPRP